MSAPGKVTVTMTEQVVTTYEVTVRWLADNGLPTTAAALNEYQSLNGTDAVFDAFDGESAVEVDYAVAERDFTFS